MTVRLSTGCRNGLAQGLGFQGMFNRGYMKIFTGSQPANADAAETGTNLGIVSASSAALTKETRATGSITITGGATSVLTVTVGGLNIIPDGAVPYNTSVGQTASDLCDAINRNGIMEASVSGAVVTLKGRPGTGVTTAAVSSTGSVTATYVNMGSGVAGVAPLNGLILGPAVAGVISKLASQVWSFAGINGTATAGWFRLYSSDTADAGSVISAAPYYPRLDGSIAVSGADLNLSNISIATGSSNTIDVFSFTIPAQ
jgi:hypothetical protein